MKLVKHRVDVVVQLINQHKIFTISVVTLLVIALSGQYVMKGTLAVPEAILITLASLFAD
jgi:hypothetical protein